MAFPTILFNIVSGLDDDTTSGAGPAIPVSGAKARTVSGGGTRVGFFEASAVDFSQVAVDGTHAVRIATSSGRKFFVITAKKTTRQAVTGAATASSAVLTSITSTTGMVAGDLIVVVGAGPSSADLYALILTVDSSSQVTMDRNASTSQAGTGITDPEQFTIHTSVTLTADTNWGCGGKRANPFSVDGAFVFDGSVGAAGGWIAEVEGGEYPITVSNIVLTANGDSNGPFTLRGSAIMGRPKLVGNNTTDLITIRGAGVKVHSFDFEKTEHCVLIDSSNASDVLVYDVRYPKSTELFDYGIRVTSAATGKRFTFLDFEFNSPSIKGISIEGAITDVLVIENGHITGNGSPSGIVVDVAVPLQVRNVVLSGLNFGLQVGSGNSDVRTEIDHLTVDACLKGILVTHLNRCKGLILTNTCFTDCSSVALEMPSGADAYVAKVDYNNFFNNALNRTNISTGPNDTVLDPQFYSPDDLDFRIGTNLAEIGYPRNVGP